MRITSGQVYRNRTFEYLFPLLQAYGQSWFGFMNMMPVVCMGIYDMRVKQMFDLDFEHHLFILIDMDHGGLVTMDYFHRLKAHDCAVASYNFDLDRPNYRMLVVKLPDTYPYAIESFKNGNYRGIVGKDSEGVYLPKTVAYRNATYDPELYTHFHQIMVEKYGYSGKESLQRSEYDIPPVLSDEVFFSKLLPKEQSINHYIYPELYAVERN